PLAFQPSTACPNLVNWTKDGDRGVDHHPGSNNGGQCKQNSAEPAHDHTVRPSGRPPPSTAVISAPRPEARAGTAPLRGRAGGSGTWIYGSLQMAPAVSQAAHRSSSDALEKSSSWRFRTKVASLRNAICEDPTRPCAATTTSQPRVGSPSRTLSTSFR